MAREYKVEQIYWVVEKPHQSTSPKVWLLIIDILFNILNHLFILNLAFFVRFLDGNQKKRQLTSYSFFLYTYIRRFYFSTRLEFTRPKPSCIFWRTASSSVMFVIYFRQNRDTLYIFKQNRLECVIYFILFCHLHLSYE